MSDANGSLIASRSQLTKIVYGKFMSRPVASNPSPTQMMVPGPTHIIFSVLVHVSSYS